MEELKQCVNCGGEAGVHYPLSSPKTFYIACDVCGIRTQTYFSVEEPTEIWNTRYPDESLARRAFNCGFENGRAFDLAHFDGTYVGRIVVMGASKFQEESFYRFLASEREKEKG